MIDEIVFRFRGKNTVDGMVPALGEYTLKWYIEVRPFNYLDFPTEKNQVITLRSKQSSRTIKGASGEARVCKMSAAWQKRSVIIRWWP